jgi:hypothetical protein
VDYSTFLRVNEFLLRASLVEKELERLAWMGGKLSPGESNLVRPMAMNEGDDEIAQSRHDLWSIARTKRSGLSLW